MISPKLNQNHPEMKWYTLLALICFSVLGSCNNETSKSAAETTPKLDGSWQLTYISGPRIAFDGLYPDKKPMLVIDQGEGRYGCFAHGSAPCATRLTLR